MSAYPYIWTNSLARSVLTNKAFASFENPVHIRLGGKAPSGYGHQKLNGMGFISLENLGNLKWIGETEAFIC